ncbi:hypothetical protein COOONC_10018 [Cooperia oncophora]
MCFSEPKRHRLCTNGMVQLFHRPHPKRTRNSNGQALFDGIRSDFEVIQDFHVESGPPQVAPMTLLETYRSKIKKMKFTTEAEKMFLSFVQTLFRFRRHYLRFCPLENFKENNQRFLENCYDLPKSWTDLIEELVDGLSEIPEPSQIPFYLLQILDVPTEVCLLAPS